MPNSKPDTKERLQAAGFVYGIIYFWAFLIFGVTYDASRIVTGAPLDDFLWALGAFLGHLGATVTTPIRMIFGVPVEGASLVSIFIFSFIPYVCLILFFVFLQRREQK